MLLNHKDQRSELIILFKVYGQVQELFCYTTYIQFTEKLKFKLKIQNIEERR